MELPGWLVLNCYSSIVLILLLIFSTRKNAARTLQEKNFCKMLIVVLVLIQADSLGRINDGSEVVFLLVQVGNFIIFLIDPLVSILALRYEDSWMNAYRSRYRYWAIPLWAGTVINAVALVISQIFNLRWFFYFDMYHNYHRGTYFYMRSIVIVLMFLLTELYVIVYRRKISRAYQIPIMIFPLVPLVLGTLQAVFYGQALEYTGITVSYLVLFIYVQNRDMNEDHLTGIANRRRLDTVMQEKVKGSSGSRTFSALMADIDHFKEINDIMGHHVGDEALTKVASLLKDCFLPGDVVARYGGDEFCVITDIQKMDELEKKINQIYEKLTLENQVDSTYHLSLSIGYAIYDPASRMSSEEFLSKIDALMYQNKTSRKKGN
jgi:diguanylate cyclase (GGDEF)-like protein